MKGYLANGLFSKADIMFNTYVASVLRQNLNGFDLFLPQEAGINDKNSYADSIMIADLDTQKLLESDVLIAVLDGVEIDAGVATEIGIFSTTGRPIIGLYTDVRQQGRSNDRKIEALIKDGVENQFMYRNLFTVGVIKKNGKIVDTIDKLISELREIGAG
ncbi:nucleoside 2-deoxyribosyltransferase [Bacillus velezensis]|uniref:nucleoside 2-deoxyribosyltransferase n=1 Tax=Bacillus velezensis TaxID=492670 RepID=UPI0018C4DB20|nr:nucleoside 2-deoxyribosyltransferase [Bacillus velezensis]QPK89881.1 nucleoside 2-deoxyribosyltransferase [Bacillus velezensis]